MHTTYRSVLIEENRKRYRTIIEKKMNTRLTDVSESFRNF